MVARARIIGVEDQDERGEDRNKLLFHAEIDQGSGAVVPARVHNVSRTGFLIEIHSDLPIGSQIGIDFADVAAPVADVVWSSDSFYGCQFHEPISKADLQAIVSSSPVRWPRFGHTTSAAGILGRAESIIAGPPAEGLVATPDGLADAATADADGKAEKFPAYMRFHGIVWVTVLLWALIAAVAWLIFG